MKICAILVQSSGRKLSEGNTHINGAFACLPINKRRTRRKGQGPKSNLMTRTTITTTRTTTKPQEPFENFCRKEENTPILLLII